MDSVIKAEVPSQMRIMQAKLQAVEMMHEEMKLKIKSLEEENRALRAQINKESGPNSKKRKFSGKSLQTPASTSENRTQEPFQPAQRPRLRGKCVKIDPVNGVTVQPVIAYPTVWDDLMSYYFAEPSDDEVDDDEFENEV